MVCMIIRKFASWCTLAVFCGPF